jgi:hypothetical protein
MAFGQVCAKKSGHLNCLARHSDAVLGLFALLSQCDDFAGRHCILLWLRECTGQGGVPRSVFCGRNRSGHSAVHGGAVAKSAAWRSQRWAVDALASARAGRRMAKDMGRTGAIKVRITEELKAAIRELAAKDARIMSAWIELALKRAVEEAKRKK